MKSILFLNLLAEFGKKVLVSNNAKNKWENVVVYMINCNSIPMYQTLRKCVKKGIYKKWIKSFSFFLNVV